MVVLPPLVIVVASDEEVARGAVVVEATEEPVPAGSLHAVARRARAATAARRISEERRQTLQWFHAVSASDGGLAKGRGFM